jgi:hypothetical protein
MKRMRCRSNGFPRPERILNKDKISRMILRGKAQTFADSLLISYLLSGEHGHSVSTIAESRGILLGIGFNRHRSPADKAVPSSWAIENKLHFEATVLICLIVAIVPPSGNTSDPPVNQVVEARSGIEPL